MHPEISLQVFNRTSYASSAGIGLDEVAKKVAKAGALKKSGMHMSASALRTLDTQLQQLHVQTIIGELTIWLPVCHNG